MSIFGHREDMVIVDDVTTDNSGGPDGYVQYMEKWMQEWYDRRRRELFFPSRHGKTLMATGLLGYLQSGEKKQHVWGDNDVLEQISLVNEYNKHFGEQTQRLLEDRASTKPIGTIDFNKRYRRESMIERCPFCGEAIKHKAVVEHRTKKGWKQRVTQEFDCGTVKITGNWKVKGPRVFLGENCTQEAL